MSGKKPFNRELFDQYDRMGREAAFKWLESLPGIEWVKHNPERYGPDIQYCYKGQEKFLEVEVKTNWKSGLFPYPTVNVLERKKKYWIKNVDLFLLSGEGCDFLFLTADLILDSPLKVMKWNKYAKDEKFYDVPVHKALFGQVPT